MCLINHGRKIISERRKITTDLTKIYNILNKKYDEKLDSLDKMAKVVERQKLLKIT